MHHVRKLPLKAGTSHFIPLLPASTHRNTINCLHQSATTRYDDYYGKQWYDPEEHSYKRVTTALRCQMHRIGRRFRESQDDYFKRMGVFRHTLRDVQPHEMIPYDCTALIIGGGLMGSMIAWWLKQRCRDDDMHVCVVEGDHSFSKCSTVLSTGGIRQQFSLPENVEMSLFTAEFLRNAGEHFRILDNDPPDIHFTPMGYLFLATTADSAEKLERNWKMQCELGAKVRLMTSDDLKLRFPFMNFDNIVLGSFGLENEGVIDPWQLLSAVREKNLSLGVQYVKGRVRSFAMQYMEDFDPSGLYPESDYWKFRQIDTAIIEPQMTDASPRPIKATWYINAAGPWAGDVARMAGIGSGSGLMGVPVPIVPRKRYVYVFHAPDGPGLDMPFLIDPSGVWCRREGYGNLYLCGKSPSPAEDALINHENLDVDYNYFDENIWPVLAARVPSFEKLKVKSGWAGWYDYNMFDQNPIVGRHFHYENFVNCAGFSGHGLQHAITAGRGIMEKLLDGAYIHVNYKKFGIERLYENRPLVEDLII